VLGAGVVGAAGLLAAVLVPFGLWRPLLVWPLLLVLTVVAVRLVGRVPAPPVPAWTAWLTAAIAAAHGVWAGATHAEQVVLRRDPGSYALFAQWIATRGRLPIDAQTAAFGGAPALRDPVFTLASPAFFQIPNLLHVLSGGDPHSSAQVQPQFLLGAPAVFSLAFWAAGWLGLFVVPAVVGALGVLAVAGLSARVAGPRTAPLAAATMALLQPVLHTSRSTYSEPAALLMVAAAACLLVDATAAAGPEARRLGLAAGAGFGLAGIVRVDAVREVVLLLPVAAALAARRHPAGGPLARGALATLAITAIPAGLLAWRYVGQVAGSLLPLLALGVLLGLGSLAVVRRARRDPPPPRHPGAARWWARAPALVTSAVLVAGVLLASRPWWLVVRQPPADPGSKVVAGLQRLQGLPIDGGRTYAEHTVQWVAWYTGPIALAIAWLVLAVSAGHVAGWWRDGGPAPSWGGPLFVGLSSTVLTLARPGITPDHPWADRRLVPVVLPTVVVAACAGVAWAVRTVRARAPAGWSGPGRTVAAGAVAALGALVLVIPAATATAPVARSRTEQGEPAAVRQVCAALRPGDVVIGVDTRARNEWPQAIRGVCGRPAGSFTRTPGGAVTPAEMQRVAARIRAAGGRPVLLAANSPDALTDLGLSPARVAHLRTTEDARTLVRRPDGVQPLDVDVWLAVPPQ
jgi:hypothetical protein